MFFHLPIHPIPSHPHFGASEQNRTETIAAGSRGRARVKGKARRLVQRPSLCQFALHSDGNLLLYNLKLHLHFVETKFYIFRSSSSSIWTLHIRLQAFSLPSSRSPLFEILHSLLNDGDDDYKSRWR
ncbi:hypothetical protein VTL71DRAFT_11937 [Oculimacula yallundae]|uniref:Uncharacterized protein n=1 Tax=Oculimacula yallundae TaxID=86028 RepID=A0ABR4CRJ0_9HELO